MSASPIVSEHSELALTPLDVPGTYAFSAGFEALVADLQSLISRTVPGAGDCVLYPPVLSRRTLERGGYLENMPQLLGTVHAFRGDEEQWNSLQGAVTAGDDWSHFQTMQDVVLAPAVCYNVYAERAGHRLFETTTTDLTSYCYRAELSAEPGRFQIFRMREIVTLGPREEVLKTRETILDSVVEMFTALGLEMDVVAASDPFFSRGQRLMASVQKRERLKNEICLPVAGLDEGCAVASSNYHLDHFAHRYDIAMADGEPVESSCFAFGLERLALGLITRHGGTRAEWPESVLGVLQPSGSC